MNKPMTKNEALAVARFAILEAVRLENDDCYEIEDLLEAVRILEGLRDPVAPPPERIDALVGEEMEMLAWCCR